MHELFEILSTDTHWQTRYESLRQAAEAMNALPEYYDYMHSHEGKLRALRFKNVPDTVAQNRAERKLRERMQAISRRYVPQEQDTDGDQE